MMWLNQAFGSPRSTQWVLQRLRKFAKHSRYCDSCREKASFRAGQQSWQGSSSVASPQRLLLFIIRVTKVHQRLQLKLGRTNFTTQDITKRGRLQGHEAASLFFLACKGDWIKSYIRASALHPPTRSRRSQPMSGRSYRRVLSPPALAACSLHSASTLKRELSEPLLYRLSFRGIRSF